MAVSVNDASDSLVEEQLKQWASLPYQSYFPNKEDCAAAYLKQFGSVSKAPYEENSNLHITSSGNWMVGLRFIQGETQSLGLRMARLEPIIFNGATFDPETLKEGTAFIRSVLERASVVEHVAAPVSSVDTFAQLVLQECGFKLADTIIAHHIDLKDMPPSDSFKNVRQATPADIERLAAIAERNFRDRSLSVNRFVSDMTFDSSRVGKMYANWVRAAIVENNCDLNLTYDDGQVSGFYTFRLPIRRGADQEIGLAMAVLSAVDARHQRKGVFASLQQAGCSWLNENGAKIVEVKTVLPNYPVNRICYKMGSKVEMTYHTFHWRRGL